MIHKTLLTFIMFTSLCSFTKKLEAAETLDKLNYTLVSSKTPIDGSPSKYYKLSLNNKSNPGSGIIIIKCMNEKFVEMPVIICEDGTIRSTDKIGNAIIGMDGGYAEKFEVLLASLDKGKDSRPIAKCTIIPFPRIVQDDKGRKIELKAITPDGEHFLIEGSGFTPNEKINFYSCSCNESGTHPFDVDTAGNFHIGYDPAVIGKTEGPFEVIFSGKDMKPLKIRHYWGKIAFTTPERYKELENQYPFPKK